MIRAPIDIPAARRAAGGAACGRRLRPLTGVETEAVVTIRFTDDDEPAGKRHLYSTRRQGRDQ